MNASRSLGSGLSRPNGTSKLKAGLFAGFLSQSMNGVSEKVMAKVFADAAAQLSQLLLMHFPVFSFSSGTKERQEPFIIGLD